MGNALAVAGQAAANQVFSSLFWVVSVLPSGKSISSRKWRKKINKSPGKRVIQLDLSRAFIFTTFTSATQLYRVYSSHCYISKQG